MPSLPAFSTPLTASRLPVGETVAMALNTLKANRLRSLLTMLGIVIGNASVITLVGVGRGAQGLAEGQLSNLGANVLFVVPGNNDTRRQGIDFPKSLVLEDALAMAEQVPTVKRVAPQITLSEVVQAGGISSTASISGVTPDFLPIRQFDVATGRFFSNDDLRSARNVAVVGPDLASKLFPGREPVGRSLRIRDQSFVVIGVLEPKGAVFGQNQDENAYVPLSTMVSRLSGRDPTYGVSLNFISVEARDEASMGTAAFQITNLLRQRHRILREDDFAVRSQKDALSIVSTITGGLTLMLAAIGAISLLVGGIGIMNIMLVSVSERTSEIGLRKALGARSNDVLLQFLIESLVLSSLGGAVGSALGIGAVTVVALVTPLPASVGAATVMGTVLLSGSIGLFFGVVPARRASRLDPIVALRSL
ncbi:MAG: FtsX-like permease family protein [Cyanobacteria bacterium K_DeepCast_35m_m2_023]|nr:FtsX-like permease family protein [Cyanobacteria bacterium K_DeepCast_35m_m2_023]